MKVTIDATNKTLGRVASEAARAILGKLSPAFQRNTVADVSVFVTNVGKMKLAEKKIKAKSYVSFSGFPGGQKFISMKEMIAKKGLNEIVRRAVYKMLPKNKLQPKRIKLLELSE